MSAKMYINLSNIEYNLYKIKEKINENTNIIAMIKANAYGLGDIEVCNFLQSLGISFFGVAHVDEGVNLRKNSVNSDIIVTSQFLKEDIQNILDYNLIVSVSSMGLLEILNKEASVNNKKVKIHIKLDTGMSRLGFNTNEVLINLEIIKSKFKNILIDGIYTHLSSADTDDEYTIKQLSNFDNTVALLKKEGYTFNYIHALNSSGLLKFPDYVYNTIRIGDILYGYYPHESLRSYISLKPSVKITAPILNIRDISKGCSISYSRTFKSTKAMKIAIIQMGYADGLDRRLSNKYSVHISNIPCKILGNICMDMCMIDVSNISDLNIGDNCTILDYDDSIYNFANIVGTINYEVISRISNRVKRIYVKNK